MKTPKFARWGRGIAGALSLTLLFSLSAAALEPYRNYTYDSEENAWVEPQAYYAADILRECQAGYALDFSDRKGLEEALRTLYREFRLGQDTGRKVSPQSEKYTRRALTARLAREVLACSAEHPSPEES